MFVYCADKHLSLMKRLYRSDRNKKIAGVCGGIGETMDIDPTIVRVVVAVAGLVTGIIPFAIGYLLAWWIVPEEGKSEGHGEP